MRFKHSVLVLLLASFPCFASEDAKKPSGPTFRTIGMGVNANDLVYIDGKDIKPLTIESDQRSSYFRYQSGTDPLVVAKMVPGPDGTPVPSEVTRASISAAVKNFLLVFFKSKDSQRLNVLSLSDEAHTIPKGGYRFVNFLETPIGVVLGSKKQIVQPGSEAVMSATLAPGEAVYQIQVFKIDGSKTTPVYSNIWSLDESQRHLIIAAPSPEALGGVEIRRLSENFESVPTENPSNN